MWQNRQTTPNNVHIQKLKEKVSPDFLYIELKASESKENGNQTKCWTNFNVSSWLSIIVLLLLKKTSNKAILSCEREFFK